MKKIATSFVFALLLLGLLINIQKSKKIKEVQSEIGSYERGYEAGYSAAISQFSNNEENLKISVDPNKKVYSYTSNINYQDEDSIRGYEDGYHKAINSMYCPMQ
jgi:hypothetical protein